MFFISCDLQKSPRTATMPSIMENQTNNTDKYQTTIKTLPMSQVEITAIISSEEFDKTRSEAIKHIGKDVELPGFRKGHVPEKMLIARIGEGAILEEMAEIAIGRAYGEILVGSAVDALGRPEVRITKIALGNPLEFTLTTAVFPKITLPDFKTISSTTTIKEEISVSDEEVEKTIDEIRKMRAKNEVEKSVESTHEEGTEKSPEGEAELPPLDDAFVKLLGDFENVDAFKAKLKENLLKEKERALRDKKRVAIMEAIIAKTTVDLPEIIVEQELHRMQEEFSQEISRMGMTFDAYMKAVGKSEEDMHKEWRPDAEKRAKVQLITSKIAESESITPDEEEIASEAVRLHELYPDADKERVRGYLEMLLTNEKVFKFLESQA